MPVGDGYERQRHEDSGTFRVRQIRPLGIDSKDRAPRDRSRRSRAPALSVVPANIGRDTPRVRCVLVPASGASDIAQCHRVRFDWTVPRPSPANASWPALPIASYVFASGPAVGGGACGRERSWTAAATGPIRTPAGRRWCDATVATVITVAVLGVSVGALAGGVSGDAGAVAAGAAAPSLAWVVGWVEQPAAGCRAYREAWVVVGE